MLEVKHYSAKGTAKKSAFSLPSGYFDGLVNTGVLHQAVTSYLGNQRQGTAATKTRSMVSGGNQKPWRQKGTGRARQGTTRAPHWRGGGVVFGPHPRDYRTQLPKKVRQLARRSALNARAREGAMLVIEQLQFEGPKTATLAGLLSSLGVAGRKVLVLTEGLNQNVYLSGRNLPRTEVMRFEDAAPYHILWSDVLVVEEGALRGVPEVPAREGGEEEAPAAGTGSEDAPAATKKPVKKAVKKVSARKPAAKKTKATAAAKTAKKKPATKTTKKPAAKKKTKGDE